MDSKAWRWTGAWVVAGVLAAAALGGCDSAPAGNAAAVRPDVTDIHPAAAPAAVAAASTSAGPAVYDMSGLIPTAPQAVTEPAEATPAAAVVVPSPVVFTPTAPASPAPRGRTHVVRRGETLFAIAKAQYGDGSQWKRLAAVNPTARGGLRVGQQLIVP